MSVAYDNETSRIAVSSDTAIPTSGRSLDAMSRAESHGSGVPQVAQHRQHAAIVIRTLPDRELVEDRRDPLLHGVPRDQQLPRNPAVRAAFGHQRQNLPLAGR